jgi:hypothetical protein
MQITTLVFWRFVSVFVLLVPPSTCFDPIPLCHAILGQNLDGAYCYEALMQFKDHVSVLFGSDISATSSWDSAAQVWDTTQFYFTKNPGATGIPGQKLVHLPLYFDHQGCKITLDMGNAGTNLVPASWMMINTAVGYIFRECVAHKPSTGGMVVYHGIDVSVTQSPRKGDYPLKPSQPIPMGHSLADFSDLVD